MKTRSILIIMMVALMLSAAVIGCTPAQQDTSTDAKAPAKETAKTSQEDKTSDEPQSLENIELSVSLWNIGDSIVEGESDAMLDYIQEKFAITITPVNVGWGDADEKYNVWAASGQLPDVIGAIAQVGTQRYFQWIEDGVVRALPDDLGTYPNVANVLQKSDVAANDVDGKKYFFPRMTYEDASFWCMDRSLIVRKDWMDALGLTQPTTEEEFKAMLEQIVASDPDGNGVDDTIGITTGGYGIMSQNFTGHGYTDMQWIEGVNGQWVPGVSTESALSVASFLRDLYKDGLLDPDFATVTKDIGIEKFVTNKAAVIVNQASPKHLDRIYENWVKVQEAPFWDSVAILNPPLGDEGYARFSEASFWSESYVSALVDDEKMDRIMMLYDYLYSDEGIRMGVYGFEGEDYEIANDEVNLLMGKREDGSPKSAGDLYKSANMFKMLAVWGADYLQYTDPSIPAEIRAMTLEARDYRIDNWAEAPVDYDVKAMNVEARNDMTVDFAASWVQFIMNTTDAADQDLYDAMVAEWNSNGFAEAVQAVTDAAQAAGK